MLLNIEPGLIIWTVITFIVLLIVLRKVAWGPILTTLEQREQTIRNSLDEAHRARQEGEQLLIQHQQVLADANREVLRLLEQGREEAERLRVSMTDQAREEAQRLTEAARREIIRERQLAMQELKNTAADLALAAAGRLLNTVMTGEDHRRLVTEFLDHFPERIEG
ncbi:MAG: F0F1 ATP synthase subunit B [Ktedonobacteraceae bacterium]|jgi:F-type H+-transporting ATPase subunit b